MEKFEVLKLLNYLNYYNQRVYGVGELYSNYNWFESVILLVKSIILNKSTALLYLNYDFKLKEEYIYRIYDNELNHITKLSIKNQIEFIDHTGHF